MLQAAAHLDYQIKEDSVAREENEFIEAVAHFDS